MTSSALRDRHHAALDTLCPLTRYDGSLLINETGRLRVRIYVHPERDHGYLADVTYDGLDLFRIKRAATASLALLGAVQTSAHHALLQLYTPIIPGLYYGVETPKNARMVTLKRAGTEPYVVVGATRNNCRTWLPFCEGMDRADKYEANSFEALLQCTEFMSLNNIWP